MQGKNTSNNKGIIEHRSYCHKYCMSASPASMQLKNRTQKCVQNNL